MSGQEREALREVVEQAIKELSTAPDQSRAELNDRIEAFVESAEAALAAREEPTCCRYHSFGDTRIAEWNALTQEERTAIVAQRCDSEAAREDTEADRWSEDEWHTDENGDVIGGAPANFVFVAKSSAREDWIAERSNVEKERDELLAAREEPQDHETLIRGREDQRERALEAGREVDELEDRLSTALERERAARERPKDSGMRIEGEVDP